MVVRIKGAVREGFWFSADVLVATLTVTNGGAGFLVDLAAAGTLAGVDSELEQIIEAIQARGTVIGLHASGEAVLQVMIDYGQGFVGAGAGPIGQGQITDAQFLTEIEAAVDGVANISNAAFTNIGTDFAAV